MKKFGFSHVLRPFLKDLARLESEEGVLLKLESGNFILRASIAAFCGDGLAVHDVFNLLGPSDNQFCRMCMYSRADLRAGSLELGQERSEDLFKAHLSTLKASNFSDESKTKTGIRGDCCLNESKYFHISRNKSFDPMHDLLCGICPMIIKLVLKHYIIDEKKFNVKYFNGKILSFQWGYCEMKNKPSANFTDNMLEKKDHTLSQKAMQIWCLIRALPFLLADDIDSDDEHMGLVIILLQIMDLIFAPKITKSVLPYLNALIKEFRWKFKLLFPNIDEINKFHHLSHYVACIRWSGPQANYSCMRFEAKHHFAKIRAEVVHNFKNPPKTLIRIFQCGQSAKWGGKNIKLFQLRKSSGKKVPIHDTLSQRFLSDRKYNNTDKVFCTNTIKVNGIEFRVGLYVYLESSRLREDNLPLFAKN